MLKSCSSFKEWSFPCSEIASSLSLWGLGFGYGVCVWGHDSWCLARLLLTGCSVSLSLWGLRLAPLIPLPKPHLSESLSHRGHPACQHSGWGVCLRLDTLCKHSLLSWHFRYVQTVYLLLSAVGLWDRFVTFRLSFLRPLAKSSKIKSWQEIVSK